MTEARSPAFQNPEKTANAESPGRAQETDEAERALGRAVSMGLPALTLIAAVGAGFLGSIGSALLVLASGALLGAIALLWASLRTLSGDAPLADDAPAEHAVDGSALGERKLRVLMALKDIENEHELGKVDDDDYAQLVAAYRGEAKQVLREIDERAQPSRDEAERVAREFLARNGIGQNLAARSAETPVGEAGDRSGCPSCHRANDSDASFCKHCGAAMTRPRAERGSRHAKA